MIETAAIILGGLLLGDCAALLITYGMFLLDPENGPFRKHLAEVSGNRPALWLAKGFLSGLLTFPLVFLSSPLALLKGLWRPTSPDQSGPTIILVHGIYHN